ncbi:MAG: lipid-binding SYLF domain-containing protein [Pseudomonadota bacterium]
MIGKRTLFLALVAGLFVLSSDPGRAQELRSDAEVSAHADEVMERLRTTNPEAERLMEIAKAVLVFPRIVKAGLLVGAAGGKGVLREGGTDTGYFLSTAVSYGLQVGATTFGYVMVLMDDASLDYVRRTEGWEIGVGPTVTVADEGFAKRLTSTTLEEGIVVFFVDQSGFFAGAGIEGTKISRL